MFLSVDMIRFVNGLTEADGLVASECANGDE